MSVRDIIQAAAGGAVEQTDPYFENTVLLLHGDGTNGAQNNTFLDSSSNNFTITRNGNTTQGTFSPYGTNWSNYFDGSGDYLTAPNNAAFQFGTGDFNIESFVYISGNSATNPDGSRFATICAGVGASSVNNDFWFTIKGNTTTTGTGVNFRTWNSGAGVNVLDTDFTISQNTWHHFAISRQGNTVRLYFNGSLQASSTYTGIVTAGTNSLTIGYSQTGGAGTYQMPLNGYASNLRIVKGTALYTSNFTPSTTPLTAVSGTSLLTCQSNRFIDNSSNNFTLTVNGNTSVQRFSPFNPTAPYSAATIGGSGYFDGTEDYVVAPDSTAFDLTGDFTIETWVYPSVGLSAVGTTTYLGICLGNEASGQNGMSIYGNANGMGVYSNGAGIIAVTNEFSTGSWYHVAVVRNGTSLKFYLNGVEKGSATNSTSFTGVAANGFSIAAMYNTSSYSVRTNGYYSNTRIVKGTAVYNSNFTPPTAPLTAVSGTSLLCNFTNAGIPDAAMMNDLETVGDAKVSTSVKKYGTGSLAFDGNGDYLSAPASQYPGAFGGGNFTIEMWAYPVSKLTTFPCLISNYTSYSEGALSLFAGHNSGTTTKYQVAINGASFPTIQSSTSIVYNTWVHLAIVRNNGVITFYINGTADGTYSTTATLNGAGGQVWVGTAGDNIANGYFNGYIDDLRITKGVARYTANFTPPNKAFPNT